MWTNVNKCKQIINRVADSRLNIKYSLERKDSQTRKNNWLDFFAPLMMTNVSEVHHERPDVKYCNSNARASHISTQLVSTRAIGELLYYYDEYSGFEAHHLPKKLSVVVTINQKPFKKRSRISIIHEYSSRYKCGLMIWGRR